MGSVGSIREAEQAAAAVDTTYQHHDPSQSFYPLIHGISAHADQHMTEILHRQADDRRAVNSDVIALRRQIQELDKDVLKVERKEMTSDEFLEKYRDASIDLEAIWKKHEEKFSYVLPKADDHFITWTSDAANVTVESIRDSITNCNTLARTLETVEIPELDMLLTHALELNVVLLRAMSKLAEQAAEGTGRTAVRNMGK